MSLPRRMKFLLETMVMGRRSKRQRCLAASLTDDLVVEILSGLPARSVCRFKCVHNLARPHLAHNRKLPQTLAGIFTMQDDENMPWAFPHFTNVLGRGCSLLSTSFDFLPANRVYLVDCSNARHLFVCNQATKKWVELPDSSRGDKPRNLCLGFNPKVSPHFYVFEFFRDYDEGFSFLVAGVEVFSSETGQWVRMEDNDISFFALF